MNILEANCPLPIDQRDSIVLGHGSGGRMTADLLRDVFLPAFGNDILSRQEDQAILPFSPGMAGRLAFTTDSFVVRPIFFPGGDIGKLAVHGTINDLAVGGAKPLYLSAAFIIEEGLSIRELKAVVSSMEQACDEAGVLLVTGDTKVVDRGKGDKLFITTTGIGLCRSDISLSVSNARPGDKILVSGTIGDHGIAIMSVRNGLEFGTEIVSDTAPLYSLVETMLAASPRIRLMRDPTRGGLASTLNEISIASNVGVRIDEALLPIKAEVKAACEILGFDPLYVANEGKLVAIVPADDAETVLAGMRNHALGKDAAIIGQITDENRGIVTLRSLIGGVRTVTLLAGEQLPRIC